jgi:hypothetical protein
MLAFARPGNTPLDELSIAVLYLTPNLYLAYACASALVWTRRYARGAEPRLRHGLALTSVGLAALVAGEMVFLAATSAVWADLTVPPWLFGIGLLFVLPGTVILMLGFAYPAAASRLAALRIWWQHRRTYHRLTPLWTLLHGLFPEDMLTPEPAGPWRHALALRGVHRRYYRRVIECRDGLVRLSPYLATPNPTDDPSLADRLRQVVETYTAGAPKPAVPVAIPAGDSLDADVHELVALSDALRAHPTPTTAPAPLPQ